MVLNYDITSHPKDYIHQVGRTARAGRSGRSIAFVTQYDVENLQKIEHLMGKQMQLYPTDEEAALLLHDRVVEAQRLANLVGLANEERTHIGTERHGAPRRDAEQEGA